MEQADINIGRAIISNDPSIIEQKEKSICIYKSFILILITTAREMNRINPKEDIHSFFIKEINGKKDIIEEIEIGGIPYITNLFRNYIIER